MLTYGPTHCALDLFSNGKRAGFIDTTHSDNALAFSTIRTPIGVIVGGDGPTVMLSAGNHGDEYEGQIILHRLMERLSPEQISGCVFWSHFTGNSDFTLPPILILFYRGFWRILPPRFAV